MHSHRESFQLHFAIGACKCFANLAQVALEEVIYEKQIAKRKTGLELSSTDTGYVTLKTFPSIDSEDVTSHLYQII